MAKRRSSAYVNALTKYYKQNVKGHFLEKAKLSVKDSLISGHLVKHRAVYSDIDGYSAGDIYGSFLGLPQTLQKELEDVRYDFMNKIFVMSQKLVPIDKKYIGMISSNDITELKKPRSYLIPEKNLFFSVSSNEYRSQAEGVYRKQKGYYKKYFQELYLPRGTYYDNGLIRDFFLSSNRRKRWQLYVDDDGTIKSNYSGFKNKRTSFGKIDEIKPINLSKTRITTKEITGGNQELKKGGTITGDRSLISYSSREGGADYEYAQVQHDNLAYEHATGKQALYLYDSFEHYRKEFINAIETKSLKAFKKQFKPNIKKRRFASFKTYGRKKK